MSMSKTIREANSLYRMGAYREALFIYNEIARKGQASWVKANIDLCKKRIENTPRDRWITVSDNCPRDIVVTLTTIRSRLKYLPRVMDSLSQQTMSPARIDLNISREPYLLDDGVSEDDHILRELKKDPRIRVNWVPNIGPYRKIWPFLEAHFSKSDEKERVFVTVDDDTLYPDHFLEQLYNSYLQHDCVIAFRGRHIEMVGENISPYHDWTWGRDLPSINNLPTGKDGVLYSTKFFTKDFLDLDAVKSIAPTADDLWIKWHCSMNGVPAVILNPEACSSDFKSFPLISYEKADREHSLYSVHNSAGSQKKNDLAVEKLEKFYKINRGVNLASMIIKSYSDKKQSSRKGWEKVLAQQSSTLPLLVFVENILSGEDRKVNFDAVVWREKSTHRYATVDQSFLTIDTDFSLSVNSQAIALIKGIAYSSEIAETVVALIKQLVDQKVRRYRFSLSQSGSEISSSPTLEFLLPSVKIEEYGLSGCLADKDCSHLVDLKKLRKLLEEQKYCLIDPPKVVTKNDRRQSYSQGSTLFRKKYLSNCHVLNLEHRTDRLKRVAEVFNTMGLQVNRVNAVFGRESVVCERIMREVSKKYDKFASSEIPPFSVENDMYQGYRSEVERNVHYAKKQGKLLSAGSLGYLLSYRKALVEGLCSSTYGSDYITVFDDDVLLHSEWEEIIKNAYWQLPENPAVIMLGAIQYGWGKAINWYSENLYCCNGTSIASHATVIHKEYARFLIDEIEKFILPLDIGALHYLKSRLFGRSFVLYPNVFIQDTSESDIADTSNQSIIGKQKDNVYRWNFDSYKVGRA